MESIFCGIGDVSTSGTFTEIDHILSKYLQHIGTADYNMIICFSNLFVLAIIFIIQYFVNYSISHLSNEEKNDKELVDSYRSYIFRHTSINFVFAALVTFVCVALVNSDINIIWNFIISPFIGFILSVWFDNEVLSKFEIKYDNFKNPLSEKKEDEHSKSNTPTSNINININNGDHDDDDEDLFVLNDDINLGNNEKIEKTINRVIKEQKNQSEILKDHSAQLTEQSLILENVQRLMKNVIRFELEDLIYDALGKGYVTPEEDKKIRIKYKDYRDNKGNGDIQELYEKRYLNLKIRDE